ncbi:MAG: K+/H+ antiporter subunit F [Xanthomonadaceae bacterium]|nr:K+/H+ antiporter subunit F [Xanthomonadaceae bacterium]MDP2185484.1 K+/H+ antiporter subunit F [Xanthomonadales bacterium]MDZ4116935.1 K+/H+ antiporter subunit F [Xanthomonadaceae bacterium]MDZ4378035.1 K+/H+ antiporter subunit F [Xanthomonadaceae bacterium]
MHAPLVHHTLSLVMAMIGLAMLLNLWRLLRGPTVPDRILALDTLYINTVALVILFGIRMGTSMYFEAALVIAMLGFVGTVALSKYVMRRDIIE